MYLKINGFLGFITPPPWRKPILNNAEDEEDNENKKFVKIKKKDKIILWNLMTQQNQLLYLHIFGEKQGQQLFHVSQRFDLYIIEKTDYNKDKQKKLYNNLNKRKIKIKIKKNPKKMMND